jgi:hypothetical protein
MALIDSKESVKHLICLCGMINFEPSTLLKENVYKSVSASLQRFYHEYTVPTEERRKYSDALCKAINNLSKENLLVDIIAATSAATASEQHEQWVQTLLVDAQGEPAGIENYMGEIVRAVAAINIYSVINGSKPVAPKSP